jgi:hypothetical protein
LEIDMPNTKTVSTSAMTNFVKALKRRGDHNSFVVFLTHQLVPVPVPMHGPASTTKEDALVRAHEALARPAFTAAWIVSSTGFEPVDV